MSRSQFSVILSAFAFAILPFVVCAQGTRSAPANNRVRLQFNSDEADAVLSILDKLSSGSPADEADWRHLFATEPYIRLKKREATLHIGFTDDDFKKFVLSPDLAAKRGALRNTLESWKHADLIASGQRVLAYLPEQASIKAKAFPVIKPNSNSFVFETSTDPTIFLYLDPEESAAKFENTVAHELHHIGYSSIESLAAERQKGLPETVKPAVEWMSAFGEGFAMLAAAGGPDVDPHAASTPKEHARWDHDMANFNPDLESLQQFFLDVVNGRLSRKESIDEKAFTFFGAQGPWYTVGYKMAVIVEKRFGRNVLIDCMLDPRELLGRYNAAAAEINRRDSKQQLALWSPELMQKISLRSAEVKH